MSEEKKTTNDMIAKTLEEIAKGNTSGSSQLVFNPETGNFDMAPPSQQDSQDKTTMNSIVKDGFAR